MQHEIYNLTIKFTLSNKETVKLSPTVVVAMVPLKYNFDFLHYLYGYNTSG